MNEYIIKLKPFPAPRLHGRYPTKQTEKYKAFRTELLMRARIEGLRDLPSAIGFTFEIPMPPSWSNKKRERMRGQLHQQKPDLDNLIKAVKDSFTYGRHLDDSHVATYIMAQKIWADEGRIILYEVDHKEPSRLEMVGQLFSSVVKYFSDGKG